METLSQHRCFGGTLGYYRHASHSTKCDMRFTAFMPEKPSGIGLVYLSGLTCTEENFTVKAGAYRTANALGLTIIAPDTSPRGDEVPDDASISLGKGAGFYVDATEAPWNRHYHMYSYVAEELPALVREAFHIRRFGLFGHSMGGHGALVIGQRNRQLFESISAFAPICRPSEDGWGPQALTRYLGPERAHWMAYDASEIMAHSAGDLPPILIDQGLADSAYQEGRLNPEAFREACAKVGQPLQLRFHEGYDHGYFFIQTFIDDHLRHHAAQLGA
jgi:S-formylglutathione hydrolase